MFSIDKNKNKKVDYFQGGTPLPPKKKLFKTKFVFLKLKGCNTIKN